MWKIKDIMLLFKKKKVDKTNESIMFQARMVLSIKGVKEILGKF